MELISLSVGVASLLVAALSLGNWLTIRARVHEISFAYEGLVDAMKEIHRLDKVAASQLSREIRQDLKRVVHVLERHIRRLVLFTDDADLVSSSILWFRENARPEDMVFIARALKFRCITGRHNRHSAKVILQKIDQQG